MALAVRRREYDHHTEQVHAAGGSSIRDLMLGLNDGLVASFAVTGLRPCVVRLSSWKYRYGT